MKIKTLTVFNSMTALQELNGTKMKILGALALKNAISKIDDAMKNVQALRREIATSKIELNEDGTPVRPDGNEQLVKLTDEGQQDMTTLFEADLDIPIEKIKPAIFGDIDVTPAVLQQLDWLLGE